MCVIIICKTGRPTLEDVVEMAKSNPDGGGIGLFHKNKTVWVKGLEADAMIKIVANAPFPFVAHFRRESTGGKHETLCHPFVIDDQATCAKNGSTTKPILFHNGTWTGWRERILNAIENTGYCPPGEWSDSRAMAYLANIYGIGFVNLVGDSDKIAVMHNGDITKHGSGVWVTRAGWEASNDYWESPHKRYGYNNNGQLGLNGQVGLQPNGV